MPRAALRIAGIALSLAVLQPAAEARGQSIGMVQSDILVVDPERLFEETRLGQRMTADFQQERDALIAKNRHLEAELEAEEKALTDLRADTTPEEFRQLADAFDEKVQRIRQESERAARDLERRLDQAPIRFMRMVEPVLAEMLRDGDSAVILDARSALLHAEVVNITDLAIGLINAETGERIPVDDAPPTGNEEGTTTQP